MGSKIHHSINPGVRYSLDDHQWSDITDNSVDCNIENCATTDYINSLNSLNSLNICGRVNWRLPTKTKLLTLHINEEDNADSIDTNIFNATQHGYFLTSESDGNFVWAVNSIDGTSRKVEKSTFNQIRLVSEQEKRNN